MNALQQYLLFCAYETSVLTPLMATVLNDVVAERARQDEKWGEQNHAPCVWMTVLGEEFGESCEQALRITFGGGVGARLNYREEMVQVAAVAIAAIESFDRQAGEGS